MRLPAPSWAVGPRRGLGERHDEQIGDASAARLAAAVPEQPLGLLVERLDPPLGVRDHDAVRRRFEHRAQPGSPLLELVRLQPERFGQLLGLGELPLQVHRHPVERLAQFLEFVAAADAHQLPEFPLRHPLRRLVQRAERAEAAPDLHGAEERDDREGEQRGEQERPAEAGQRRQDLVERFAVDDPPVGRGEPVPEEQRPVAGEERLVPLGPHERAHRCGGPGLCQCAGAQHRCGIGTGDGGVGGPQQAQPAAERRDDRRADDAGQVARGDRRPQHGAGAPVGRVGARHEDDPLVAATLRQNQDATVLREMRVLGGGEHRQRGERPAKGTLAPTGLEREGSQNRVRTGAHARVGRRQGGIDGVERLGDGHRDAFARRLGPLPGLLQQALLHAPVRGPAQDGDRHHRAHGEQEDDALRHLRPQTTRTRGAAHALRAVRPMGDASAADITPPWALVDGRGWPRPWDRRRRAVTGRAGRAPGPDPRARCASRRGPSGSRNGARVGANR